MEVFLICIILLIMFPEQMGALLGIMLGLGVIAAGFAAIAVAFAIAINLSASY